MSSEELEPDWDAEVSVTLSLARLAYAAFASAYHVHTGWESCIDPELVVHELNAVDPESENHCRFVEQEYEEDDSPDTVWHDWTVELKIGEIHLSAHWRLQVGSPGSEWEWCTDQAQGAFERACMFVGKRVSRGLVIDELPGMPAETRH